MYKVGSEVKLMREIVIEDLEEEIQSIEVDTA
jgi:hypothetical protein